MILMGYLALRQQQNKTTKSPGLYTDSPAGPGAGPGERVTAETALGDPLVIAGKPAPCRRFPH